MTVAEIEAAINRGLGAGSSVSDATTLTRIDEAITAAGQAAVIWNGSGWWWAQAALKTFDTVDGTSTYALKTVNSNAMSNLWAVQKAILADDWPLQLLKDKQAYDEYTTLYGTESRPTHYAIWGDMTMGLVPCPNAAETITVSYIQRHSKITNAGSLDTALIVPPEFHGSVYVAGALWLLRHETLDISSLRECPQFVAAMQSMASADPSFNYDDATGWGHPASAHITVFPTDGANTDYGIAE